MLGVVSEEDDLTMDYVREKEEELVTNQGKSQPLNTGYQFRPSDRWRSPTVRKFPNNFLFPDERKV